MLETTAVCNCKVCQIAPAQLVLLLMSTFVEAQCGRSLNHVVPYASGCRQSPGEPQVHG